VLTLPASIRVFLALDAVDMRGSFDALAGSVRRLGLDPVDGHLYVFLNRRRTMMKILFFERNGWCLFCKRLERGTYQLPAAPRAGDQRVVISTGDLALILEGIDLSRAPRRRRYRPDTAPQG
jgi:transposase